MKAIFSVLENNNRRGIVAMEEDFVSPALKFKVLAKSGKVEVNTR